MFMGQLYICYKMKRVTKINLSFIINEKNRYKCNDKYDYRFIFIYLKRVTNINKM